jgi:drug/metabolite transporter (DMT)-like permease
MHSILLLVLCIPISALMAPLLGGVSLTGIASARTPLVLMVASATLGGVLYFKGVQHLGASLGQIAFSSIIAWGALLSAGFLGSHFSVLQLVGGVVLMGAIWLAQYEHGMRFNQSILYVVASAACFACFQVTSARASQAISAGTYLLVAYSGPALLTAVTRARRVRRDWRGLRTRRTSAIVTTIPAAVTSVSYYSFAFLAYRLAPDPGIVVLLLTSQVVVAVILAMLMLGERRHPVRTLSAGVAAMAAAMAIKT